MIPSDELRRLVTCARSAWNLATQGRTEEGYAVLDLGLTGAETSALNAAMEGNGAPEPWAAELAARYRSEMGRYLAAHGKTLGRVCVSRQAQFTRTDAREVSAAARGVRERSEELRRRARELTQRAGELRRGPDRPEKFELR